MNIAGGTHHAYPDHGQGYCVLNDVAIAIRQLTAEGLITFQRKRLTVHDADRAATSVSFSPLFLGAGNAG